MAKKMTIVEQFGEVVEILRSNGYEAQAKFIEERKEAHAKKNASRKPSKVQTENEGYKEEILEFLDEGGKYTIAELIKAIPSLNEFSTSKVSALVRQLKEDKLVVRTEEKGKAYFAKA